MQKDSSIKSTPKISSISHRFSFALISVITLLLIIFAVVVILLDIKKIENEMETRLTNAIELAKNSLPTPLWNLDYVVVNDFVDALFLDESIIYAKISWGDQVVTEKMRHGTQLQNIQLEMSQAILKNSEIIAKSSDIYFKGSIVSNIIIVMSRVSVKEKSLHQIYGIIALMVLIIAAIWLTSIFATKRYISHPLMKLQNSAELIAQGDLDAFVDKSSNDEIGVLANHLDIMRGSIKQLFAALRESKQEIEEYSRTLEHKVETRTQALAQSVDELKALGEVSRVVGSTLDLETVLKSIVRHAVELSEADAGTIYEFDEAERVFVPRTNYGVSKEYIETMREARYRVGDKTFLGQAAIKQAPDQISDLVNVPDYAHSYVRKAGFRALLAVPLLRKDRLIGGLVVRRKSAGEFAVPIVDLLQAFAAQSSLAIHNARLFNEIEEKGREIEIVSKHKSEFLANMSHELRTPLNAILGYTELILDDIYGDVSEKIREVLERLEKNGRHLLSLINDVLDLSKIEAGRLMLSINDYSMGEVILTVFNSVEALAAEKQLDLTVSDHTNHAIGKGDEQRIAQVLLNLIGNAIKFTEEGSVKVDSDVLNESFLVSVSDTGPGLSEADQNIIFEEFQQADGSSTRKKGGTGLGLSISKKIVEMHGGRIWVESTLGEGAMFKFKIPVRVESQRKPI